MGQKEDQYTIKVKSLIQDAAGKLTPTQAANAIECALETYSRIRPRNVVKDIQGDGTGTFNVSGLTGYMREVSGNPEIECPISTIGKPNLIDPRDWLFYDHPTLGLQIRLLSDAPTEPVRFSYGILHTIHKTDASQTTVLDSDFNAFCKLAAAEALEILARLYTQTTDGTVVDLDMTSFNTKGREYESRAKTLRTQAEKHFGIGAEKEAGAASVTKNWDTRNSLGGDRLTHRRRFR